MLNLEVPHRLFFFFRHTQATHRCGNKKQLLTVLRFAQDAEKLRNDAPVREQERLKKSVSFSDVLGQKWSDLRWPHDQSVEIQVGEKEAWKPYSTPSLYEMMSLHDQRTSHLRSKQALGDVLRSGRSTHQFIINSYQLGKEWLQYLGMTDARTWGTEENTCLVSRRSFRVLVTHFNAVGKKWLSAIYFRLVSLNFENLAWLTQKFPWGWYICCIL